MLYDASPNSLLIPQTAEPLYDGELYDQFTDILATTHREKSFLDTIKPDKVAFAEARAEAESTDSEEAYDRVVAIRPVESDDQEGQDVNVSEAYLEREARLREFRAGLRSGLQGCVMEDDQPDLDSMVSRLYLRRTNELIAETMMLRAVQNGSPGAIRLYNEFLYGRPNNTVFKATVQRFRNSIKAAEGANYHPDVQRARSFAEANLPTIEDGDVSILGPDPEVFARVRAEQFGELGFFTLINAGIELPEKGPIRPEVGERIHQQGMENIEAGHYRRVMQSGGWAADNERETFSGPEEYSMIMKRFMGLVQGHEKSHVLQWINGGRQPLLLSQAGLDRYERGNEGAAVILEQIQYDTFDDFAKTLRNEDIMRRHLATSFMAGLWPEGTTNKDFIKTLGAIDLIFEDANNKRGLPHDKIVEKANKRTWALVERVLGRKIYKDMLYLEGNIDCWNNAGMISQMNVAKHDIASRLHAVPLKRLGILR